MFIEYQNVFDIFGWVALAELQNSAKCVFRVSPICVFVIDGRGQILGRELFKSIQK